MNWVMPDWVDPKWIDAATRFFSLPEDASFWGLLNSPFLVAIVATIIGFRLNARLSNTQEVADTALGIALAGPQSDELDEGANDSEPEEYEPMLARRSAASRSTLAFWVGGGPDELASRPGEAASASPPDAATDAGAATAEPKPIPPDAVRDFRKGSETLIENARRFIQDKISSDTDKRHKRTYDKISAGNPIARAIALKERRQLSEEQSAAIIEMFKTWNKYSKGLASRNAVPRSVVHRLQRLWEQVEPPTR